MFMSAIIVSYKIFIFLTAVWLGPYDGS